MQQNDNIISAIVQFNLDLNIPRYTYDSCEDLKILDSLHQRLEKKIRQALPDRTDQEALVLSLIQQNPTMVALHFNLHEFINNTLDAVRSDQSGKIYKKVEFAIITKLNLRTSRLNICISDSGPGFRVSKFPEVDLGKLDVKEFLETYNYHRNIPSEKSGRDCGGSGRALVQISEFFDSILDCSPVFYISNLIKKDAEGNASITGAKIEMDSEHSILSLEELENRFRSVQSDYSEYRKSQTHFIATPCRKITPVISPCPSPEQIKQRFLQSRTEAVAKAKRSTTPLRDLSNTPPRAPRSNSPTPRDFVKLSRALTFENI